jgi:ArsR family transcriptional regulator
MITPPEHRIFKLQSEICKVLSNPSRLQVLHALRDGEKTVTDLVATTGFRQANVSQHLALMRLRNMVAQRRDGNEVYYRISDQRIIRACDIMQSFILNRTSEDSKLVKMEVSSLRQ